MKDLYIFVTTDRPDQYLNSIVHRIEEGTTNIIFVQVEDGRSKKIQLNLLQATVYDLLQNLASGCYKYYVGDNKGAVISLDSIYDVEEFAKLKARYSLCLSDSINWRIKRIQYLELRQYISLLKRNPDVIVDVTSVSKVYIGDIIACCLIENINKLFTFELSESPDFDEPWKSLIHALEDSEKNVKKYNYINLVETPIFKESTKAVLIRTPPLLISIIGTIIFIAIALVATFVLGFSSMFSQVMSTIGTVLGIASFFLIYFPVRGK